MLDGAHNLAAVKELAHYLKSASDTKWTLVIGIFDDKPFKEMIATLMPYCHNVIATRPDNSRAFTPEILATQQPNTMQRSPPPRRWQRPLKPPFTTGGQAKESVWPDRST